MATTKKDSRKRGDRAFLPGAVVTAAGTVIAAVVSAIALGLFSSSGAAPPSPTAPATRGPTYPVPTCPGPSAPLPGGDTVAFTNLRAGGPVDYGVTPAEGQAALTMGHSLWLLAWASAIGRMYVISGGPVEVVNGTWRVNGLYLGEGNTNDEGKFFCVTAMIVDAAGAEQLAHSAKTGSPMSASELPHIATATTVVVRLRHGTPPTS